MNPRQQVPFTPPGLRQFDSSGRRRRRQSRLTLAAKVVVLLAIVGGAAGLVAIWTNTLGFGDKWEHLLAKVDLVLNPPPDRDTAETIASTPQPIRTPTPAPTANPTPARSLRPGATPTPKPTPTKAPVRSKVNVSIIDDPNAVFAHEVDVDMCAAAGVQMVLAFAGKADTSAAFQRTLDGRVKEWDSWKDSHNGRWGPGAMIKALEAYGVMGYQIRAFDTRDDALLDAARAISETRSPVILMAWRGAHTWIMSGYRATADPTVFNDAQVTGAFILDPWYPDWSSIWGQSDAPGAFQDSAEMIRNFLPWKRPEGLYPARDGKFITIVPTAPITGG